MLNHYLIAMLYKSPIVPVSIPGQAGCHYRDRHSYIMPGATCTFNFTILKNNFLELLIHFLLHFFAICGLIFLASAICRENKLNSEYIFSLDRKWELAGPGRQVL